MSLQNTAMQNFTRLDGLSPLVPQSPMKLTGLASPASQELSRDVSSRFGIRLRELRLARNMTQLRMSEAFGIDRSFISDIERGRKSVSLLTLEIIAIGMKVSLSELLRDL